MILPQNPGTSFILLLAYPTKARTNPVFYVTLLLMAFAVVILRAIAKSVFQNPNLDFGEIPARDKWLARPSLVCWAGAIPHYNGREHRCRLVPPSTPSKERWRS